MPTKTKPAPEDGASRLIDSIQDAERSALEAARKLVDTVDGAFPVMIDGAPRQRIIASTFKMVEEVVGASNRLAQDIVNVTEGALGEGSK